MKSFKELVLEVEEPRPGDEKRFKAKHVIQKHKDPGDGVTPNKDEVFDGSNVKKDNSKAASYENGEDKKVYESLKKFRDL